MQLNSSTTFALFLISLDPPTRAIFDTRAECPSQSNRRRLSCHPITVCCGMVDCVVVLSRLLKLVSAQ